MAKKNKASAFIKLKSTVSDYYYYTLKNKKNTPGRLKLKKYDPTIRAKVEFLEEK
jgi:large subunit ribosomal protein L33